MFLKTQYIFPVGNAAKLNGVENLILSVVVQYIKTRALHLSWFSRSCSPKFKHSFFHIAKLRFLTTFANFQKNSRIFKKISWDSSPLYTYLNMSKLISNKRPTNLYNENYQVVYLSSHKEYPTMSKHEINHNKWWYWKMEQ